MSLEIDPIHVAVSRHHLDRALLSLHAEIWVGQLQDTMARVVEAFGANCLAFIFMDQRGTTFHEDLAKLEGMTTIAPLANTTADNTLKPGSPVQHPLSPSPGNLQNAGCCVYFSGSYKDKVPKR